jgi:ABC-type phosphonate transport system ATPase subunit
MAFLHVDYAVRSRFAKADWRERSAGCGMQRRASAASRRGEIRLGEHLGLEALPVRGVEDPVSYEAGERHLVEMLHLAAAAARKMAARRIGVVRPRLQTAIGLDDVTRRGERDVAAACRHPVTFRGNARDFFRFVHSNCA